MNVWCDIYNYCMGILVHGFMLNQKEYQEGAEEEEE